MSKGWIIGAIAFFFFCCCAGGVLMAGLMGPGGINSEEWRETFGPRDAGQEPSSSDAQSPTQP